MSFEILDHAEKRIVTVGISDLLTNSVGSAIKFAGKSFNVDPRTSNFVAQETVVSLMAVLAGARGVRFNNYEAARAFCVGQVQLVVSDHIEAHRHHYIGDIEYEDDWTDLKAFVAREGIAGLDAMLRPRR